LALVVRVTHEAFDGIYGLGWICNRLAFRGITHFPFAAFHKTNNRWGCAFSFAVRYYHWFIAFHYSNAGIGCSKVYSDNFTHVVTGYFEKSDCPGQSIMVPWLKWLRITAIVSDFQIVFRRLLTSSG
jgi:NAD-specific glutamate dehydrogenase